MGGKIWVESIENNGSVFHFTIKAAISRIIPPKVFLKSSTPALTNKRILIVDDNDTNLHILSIQSKNWGMIPRSTKNPAEALNWITRDDPFDIAVLDMLMPEIDGISLAKEIRKYRSKENLPIIILSSSGSQNFDKEMVNQLLNAIITKPIKQSQLHKILILKQYFSFNNSFFQLPRLL